MDIITQTSPGRYYIGPHELTNGVLIEFVDDERSVFGRIEYDGLRYMVACSGGAQFIPLAEIVKARYIGGRTASNTK